MFDIYIKKDDQTYLLHDARPTYSTQKVTGKEINEEKNAISSLSFTVYPDNECYDLLSEYKTYIEAVKLDGEKAFIGRLLQIVPAMDSSGIICKSVVCEDRLGFLQDSVQSYQAETTYTTGGGRTGLEKFCDSIFANHNLQVEAEKAFHTGIISLSAYSSSIPIKASRNYEKTFDYIKTQILDVYGGEMRLREDGGLLYLDIADRLGTLSETEIRLSRNMQSASFTPDPSGIITKLIPLGAKINDTKERLTIASVNGGRNYIDDTAMLLEYGDITDTHIWEDITSAAQLKTAAQNWLQQTNRVKVSISVSALDLSYLGLDAERFRLYDLYRIVNPLLGVDTVAEIVKLKIDLDAPYNSTFEMGDVEAVQTAEIVTGRISATQAARQASQALSQTAALSSDYTAFKAAAEERFSATGDYITEAGVLQGWRYQRYNSGIVKCWKAHDFGNVNITTAAGQIFIGNTAAGLAFPFSFSEIPSVFISELDTSFSVFSPTGAVTTSGIPTLTVFRPTALTAVPVKAAVLVTGYISTNFGGD